VSDTKDMPRLDGQHVLVVEDEELIALMLVDVLEEHGATVLGPAGSLPDALALADRSEMTAALLDLNLKGEAVYPVADRLAARGVPFVFLTGYGQGQLAARHAQAPVLTKPFGPRQLADLFSRMGWAAPV